MVKKKADKHILYSAGHVDSGQRCNVPSQGNAIKRNYANTMLFTLIELIIVIAIIAILMSILLPALKRARDTALGISCISNLKQINVAYFNYMGDFNSYIPPREDRSKQPLWPFPSRWFEYLMSAGNFGTAYSARPTYENRVKVLYCPSKESKSVISIYYSPNDCISPYNNGVIWRDAQTVPFTKVGKPSSCILNGDARSGTHLDYQNSGRFDDRHKGGANMSFCDGHVEWKRNASIVYQSIGESGTQVITDRKIIWYGYNN